MLFFTRSFLCIGAIVLLAEGPAQLWDSSNEAVTAAGQVASGQLRGYCAHDTARCLALAGTVAGAMASRDQPRAAEPTPVKAAPEHGAAARRRPTAPPKSGAPEPHN